jgi:iron complex outermembrane receptor protein
VRFRYISSMDNRASVQFPGETSFTGPGSIVYTDIGATWEFMENSALRIGVNNVTDEEPPTYAPNVQSGTDPSMYDVIGRRVYVQAKVKF